MPKAKWQPHIKTHNMKQLLFIAFIFLSVLGWAQSSIPYHHVEPQTNAWLMYFGDHPVYKKWGVHLEGQLRRADGFQSPQQLLLRTGINYQLLPQSFVTLGYCWVNTYPYGAFPSKSIFPENRIWEQFQTKNSLGRVEWVSRFRLEQRWIKAPTQGVDGSWAPGNPIFSNRFRSLQRFSIPLKGTKIEDHSWYISCYDELFVQFGKNVGANVFDQNRAYVAIGTKIPKLGRVEIGYLNQLIVKSNGINVESNNTFQLGISFNLPLHHEK